MSNSKPPGGEDGTKASPLRTRLPPCPVCEGMLLPMGNGYRCSRCQWSVCLGCEGGGGALEALDVEEQ